MTHEQSYNTNIEKSILSSILFEPKTLQDISNILNVEDFYLPAHQLIYNAMLTLNKQDLPIDEEFLKKKFPKIDECVMLDILAANPISNILAYAKELKTDAINRQMAIVGSKVAHGDSAAINELISLQDRLNTIDGIKQLKRDDKTFNSIFDKFDIDFEKIFRIASQVVLFSTLLLIITVIGINRKMNQLTGPTESFLKK